MPFTPTFSDLVRNYTTTTGTAPFVLGEAVNGYRSFASAVQPGDSFYYSATGIDKPAEFEVGRGTLQSDGTISREPLAGLPTNFTGGYKAVALVAAAEWYEAVQSGSVLAAAAVPTRQALAALTDTTKPALLHEVGREGIFTFDPSDRSADVSSDPRQAIYIAPSSEESGASGAWVRRFEGPVNVRWFGAVGDSATNDHAAVQSALDFVALNWGSVLVPTGTFLLSRSLSIPDGVTLEGAGNGSMFYSVNAGAGDPWIINRSGGSDFTIRNLSMVPDSSGADRAAIRLDACSRARMENILVQGQSNAGGIYLFECDDCVIDGLQFNGGAQRQGYAGYIAGCRRCSIVDSTASSCRFGFVIIGQDVRPDLTRTTEETFGNNVRNCHVSGHTGHAFDINGAVGTQVVGCSASDYAGDDINVAFQAKGGSGGDAGENTGTTSNVFTGCTARNCPSGFGGQAATHAVFIGCTAINVSSYGFTLNGMSACRFVGCNVREFGIAGIWMSGSSRNTFDGIGLETSTATAKGIVTDDVSGSSASNNFDNITTGSTLAAFIDISPGASNNRFGMGCRSNAQPISDASGTSLWPLRVHTNTFNTNSVANAFSSEYLHRGMQVVAARFSCTIAITGGQPQIIAGNIGASSRIVGLQPITALAAGATQSLTINPAHGGLMDGGSLMQASVAVASSAGQGFVTFEGLPQL